jgi:hypothetical protein
MIISTARTISGNAAAIPPRVLRLGNKITVVCGRIAHCVGGLGVRSRH